MPARPGAPATPPASSMSPPAGQPAYSMLCLVAAARSTPTGSPNRKPSGGRGSGSPRSTPSGDMPARWQRRCRRRPECWTRSTSSPWPTRWSTRSVSAFSRRRWATAAATATRSIEIRRLLCRGLETLSDSQLRKVETALQAGDPPYATTVAWAATQASALDLPRPNAEVGRTRALAALESLPNCPVPEVARLGRTLRAWRDELLAYFATDGASNGPTEAMNLLIEKRRRAAHGFRNFRNYRLRLLLAHGLPCQDQLTAQIRTRRPRFVA